MKSSRGIREACENGNICGGCCAVSSPLTAPRSPSGLKDLCPHLGKVVTDLSCLFPAVESYLTQGGLSSLRCPYPVTDMGIQRLSSSPWFGTTLKDLPSIRAPVGLAEALSGRTRDIIRNAYLVSALHPLLSGMQLLNPLESLK